VKRERQRQSVFLTVSLDTVEQSAALKAKSVKGVSVKSECGKAKAREKEKERKELTTAIARVFFSCPGSSCLSSSRMRKKTMAEDSPVASSLLRISRCPALSAIGKETTTVFFQRES
jgi:hypothetical protein